MEVLDRNSTVGAVEDDCLIITPFAIGVEGSPVGEPENELIEALTPSIDGEHDDGDDDGCVVEPIHYSTPDGKSHKLTNKSGPTPPPKVGMVFSGWEAVERYFRSYAKQQGFGILRAHGAYRYRCGKRTEEKRAVIWTCERFGVKDSRRLVNGKKVKLNAVPKSGVTFATRSSKKCECPVTVYAAARFDGDWEIRKAVLEHAGHSPTPHKSKFVTQFRQDDITPAVRKKLFNDVDVGIKIPLIHRSLAKERNGLENTTFTQRDLRNVVAKRRRAKVDSEGGDANAMVNFFRMMKEKDDNFFHVERVDEIDRLKDVMWVDARSRAAYKEFSDVVCFDTTYLTNKFKLIFGNFVGVNHHGHTLLFGCALLSHETSETFEWLFSTWLKCMENQAPGGFLTDQCAAMRKALRVVMPMTRHRWCLWHILQKFSSKLGSYAQYDEFKDVLQDIIYDSLTVEDFESDWKAAIEKYKLQENDWLLGLYEERLMWVPVYMKHIFWAGMKTTQRSESINSFFDSYVSRQTMLHEFASQYFAALESRIDAEEQADADSERRKLHTVTPFRIEVEFQSVYTTKKFYEFQVECMKIMFVHVSNPKKISEFLIEHNVVDCVYFRDKNLRKDCPTDKRCEYTLSLDVRNNESWCNCKLFECHGIMCRHIIKVFDFHKIKKLPDMFILNRWRKDIVRPYTKVKIKYQDPDKTDELLRLDRIQLVFDTVSIIAVETEEDTEILIDLLEQHRDKLEQLRAGARSSKEGENAPRSMCLKEKDYAATTPRSKEGENSVIQEPHTDLTPSSVGNKKRTCDNNTPPSVKKPSLSPPSAATAGAAESVGVVGAHHVFEETTALAESVGAVVVPHVSQHTLTPTIIKDPPLPKNPRNRPIESRYKSAVELNTTGLGKAKSNAATTKAKKGTAKQLEECTIQLQQQQQAMQIFLERQASLEQATLHQQTQQQQISYAWMYNNFPIGVNRPPLIQGDPSCQWRNLPTQPSPHHPHSLPDHSSFGGIGMPQRSMFGPEEGSIGYMTRRLVQPTLLPIPHPIRQPTAQPNVRSTQPLILPANQSTRPHVHDKQKGIGNYLSLASFNSTEHNLFPNGG